MTKSFPPESPLSKLVIIWSPEVIYGLKDMMPGIYSLRNVSSLSRSPVYLSVLGELKDDVK